MSAVIQEATAAAKIHVEYVCHFGDWELVLASHQDQEMFLKQLDVQVENKIIGVLGNHLPKETQVMFQLFSNNVFV
jgi:predicted membrane-bound spermidine synthase